MGQMNLSLSLRSRLLMGTAAVPYEPGSVLLIEGGTDKLLIEGGTDAILLEGNT